MRLYLLFLFFPVLAAAQPVAINPASIAGYFRADLGGGPEAENVLLVYDSEGEIDLYIYTRRLNSGVFGAPEVYVPGFAASTRNPPQLRRLSDNSFSVTIQQSSGIGAYRRETRIAYRDGAFRIITITNDFSPNTGEGTRRCSYNLDRGVAVLTSISGAVVEANIGVGPLPLDGFLPNSAADLCVD